MLAESPSVAIAHLRTQSVDVVISAVNGDDMWSRNRRSNYLPRFERTRDEDVARETQTRCMGSNAVAQVSG